MTVGIFRLIEMIVSYTRLKKTAFISISIYNQNSWWDPGWYEGQDKKLHWLHKNTQRITFFPGVHLLLHKHRWLHQTSDKVSECSLSRGQSRQPLVVQNTSFLQKLCIYCTSAWVFSTWWDGFLTQIELKSKHSPFPCWTKQKLNLESQKDPSWEELGRNKVDVKKFVP